MNLYIYQLKQAYLSLKQKPGFVLSVVSTMGISLGALLCVLTLAYLLLIEPFPYPKQDKLVKVEHALLNEKGVNQLTAFTYPSLHYLYENQDVFEQSTMVNYESNILTSLSQQPMVNTAYVTPEWFSLFGASFIQGRGFEKSEAINTHQPVAIISYATWKSMFGLDSDILNKKVTIKGTSFGIIGVLAQEFAEPEIQRVGRSTAIWLPWDFNSNAFLAKNWGDIRPNLTFVGRLKNGLSTNQAEQNITSLINDVWRSNVSHINIFKGWNINMRVRSFNDLLLGESKKTTYLLLYAVFGLVIVACANIANLFLSRAAGQRQNLAIHKAVGAKHSHLFGHFFFEALLLMFISVVLAFFIASSGFAVIREFFSTILPRTAELEINSVTIIAAVITILSLSSLFSHLSNNTLKSHTLNKVLQSSGKGTGIHLSKLMRNTLIVTQISVATAIIFVSLSLFKNSIEVINDPLGFDLENISQLSLVNTTSNNLTNEAKTSMMKEFANKLSLLPQVKSVSKSSSPFIKSGEAAFTTLVTNEILVNENRYVDHKYFQMIKQPLLDGSYFDEVSVKEQSKVLIVNDVYANQIAHKSSAVGLKLKHPSGELFTIIGVVKGIKTPNVNTVPMRTYRPERLFFTRLLIETNEHQQLTRDQVIAVLKSLNNTFSISDFENLNDKRNTLLFMPIATAITAAIVTILSLLLSGIGLFGILTYSTQIRRFEIGTHMAVGAKGKDITGMILKDNTAALLAGIAISLLILLTLYISFNEKLTHYLSLELIPVYISTLVIITLISFFACYLPLRQYINKPAIQSLRGSE